MLSGMSQAEKDKYCTVSHIMWNLKKKVRLIETEFKCGFQVLGWWGKQEEVGQRV